VRVIECSGMPREIGQATGEALRDEIRECLTFVSPHDEQAWARRLPAFLDALRKLTPDVLEEMDGVSEGADLPAEEIYRLNLPMFANELHTGDGCTNFAFTDGPDGPLWAKNNDGGPPGSQRPVCVRLVRPGSGIPVALFQSCGMIAITDGMNAEGLAVGHSSVGSVFQQSDHHAGILPMACHALQHCRTVAEYVRMMAAQPTRGKGHSFVCVDRSGAACSIEAPCPVLQVRRPDAPGGVFCVNCYLLPQLANADRRSPAGKKDALARSTFLAEQLAKDEPTGVERAMALLHTHGPPIGLCRHGECDHMHTEYSMIGLPRQRRVLFCHGRPCSGEFEEIVL